MDEPAERLVDQRDVRFAEQVVDVLGRAQDDPVERQLEQIAARLDAHARRGALLSGMSAVSSSTLSIGPPASIRCGINSREFRSARKKLCVAKRLGALPNTRSKIVSTCFK